MAGHISETVLSERSESKGNPPASLASVGVGRSVVAIEAQ